MTKPDYRATPEQWAVLEETGTSCMSACILELRARIEALEATQHAHVDTSHLTDAKRKQIQEELARPATFAELLMPPPRNALSQPEPVAPTDEALYELWNSEGNESDFQDCRRFARALLDQQLVRRTYRLPEPVAPTDDALDELEARS